MAPCVPPSHLVQGSLASGEGILCLGLPRTGSLSLAIALTQLGYPHVHHAALYNHDQEQWRIGTAAALAHRPWIARNRKSKPKAWTKEQWDNWLGQFQAVTDAAGLFAPQLLEMYPDAKVILVVRPFEKWSRSMMDTLLAEVYSWDYPLRKYFLDPLTGQCNTWGMRALIGGWIEADTLREAEANLRRKYDEHHRLIRESVPPEQLLEYQMGDGWEPLAKFLGKDVPDVPFPHLNETATLNAVIKEGKRTQVKQAFVNIARMMSPAFWLGLGYLIARVGFSRGPLMTGWRSLVANHIAMITRR